MRLFSYKLARDFGFAPNPFGGVCTLAACKPQIRRSASIGDLIVGCGGKDLELVERMIFVLRIEGKCTFQEYWDDTRFEKKRPYFGGNQRRAYGDNIYHHDEEGGWVQEKSHHSYPDGSLNESNRNTDTNADAVVWGTDFVYWGRDAPKIPHQFRDFDGDDIYPSGRAYRARFDDRMISEVDRWFSGLNDKGCVGRPTSWD